MATKGHGAKCHVRISMTECTALNYISENHADGIIGKMVACQLFCSCTYSIYYSTKKISYFLTFNFPKHQSQVNQADSDPELWCTEPFTC